MKIAFIDVTDRDYHAGSPYQMAMGGSQSALCYLAAELAKTEHDVFLFNQSNSPNQQLGVESIPITQVTKPIAEQIDIVILLNTAGPVEGIRTFFPEKTKMWLWEELAHDQPATQALKEAKIRELFDGYLFVSEWQRQSFIKTFQLDAGKTHILKNAIAPFFQKQFMTGESILAAKEKPPTLAYTSTPFRGLNLLPEIFPQIRAAIPGIRLKIFSSMQVYQHSSQQDIDAYGALYNQCRAIEGIEYIGSIPQAELAQELKRVSILCYPNTFAETSCIAVMEALASGCQVITSNLGALPETGAGFAHLIPIEEGSTTFLPEFIEKNISVLQAMMQNLDEKMEDELQRQVKTVNQLYSWEIRATEFLAIISTHY